MDSAAFFANVAVEGLAYHFDAQYSYKIPFEFENMSLAGCRVMVPFGNGNRKKQGLILSVKPILECEKPAKLKSVSAVLDSAPLFSQELLSLVCWLKENTFCTYFEAAKSMLPAGIGLDYVISYIANSDCDKGVLSKLSDEENAVFSYLLKESKFVKREKLLADLQSVCTEELLKRLVKKGAILTNVDTKRKTGDLTVKNVRLACDEEQVEGILGSLTAKQKSVARLLLDIGTASVKEVCYFTGVTSAVVAALVKKGVAELYDSEVYRKPKYSTDEAHNKNISLTGSQENAYKYLSEKYKSGQPSVNLLYGVTGSGKTQVFLRLIEDVVSDGKGVIVMVPEIALTPQTLNLFYSHFGDNVAVFHSALSAGERIDEWKRVRNGEVKIVVGTRSAVFAPFDNLGLIVMDEEQEHTYKSEMSPRYHAREVAKFRCAKSNATLVLSSATPSLETFKHAQDGRYGFVKLEKRYGKAVLPDVVTVDTTDCKSILCSDLCYALEDCLSQKKQAILLMNRRGYNTFAVCSTCKTVLTCQNCSISLTYHSANRRLMCHYCGHSESYVETCKVCGEKAVRYAGFGTQKIEDELKNMFPNARVLRMDADTTMAKYSYQDKLSAFAKGDYDIMLGTQMVAKGLDFPNVTIVGIVSIDNQLYNDDFRASEKAFDLLTQVIGRSGRGDFKGKAYIQTMLPDNEIIELSAAQNYDEFYKTENIIRKTMVYPPYCDICSLTFVSENKNKSFSAASSFFERLKEDVSGEFSDVKISVLGPLQPKIEKISNKYRHILTVKCRNSKRFREMMKKTLVSFMKESHGDVSVTVDINPLS